MSDTLRYRLECNRCGHRWTVGRKAVDTKNERTDCPCPKCGGSAYVNRKERQR